MAITLVYFIGTAQTLKRPKLRQASATGSHSPSNETQDPKIEDNPLIAISNALAPRKDKLTILNLDPPSPSQRRLSGTCAESKPNAMSNIDALFSTKENSSQSHDLFKASYWSPAGFNHLGGYVVRSCLIM